MAVVTAAWLLGQPAHMWHLMLATPWGWLGVSAGMATSLAAGITRMARRPR